MERICFHQRKFIPLRVDLILGGHMQSRKLSPSENMAEKDGGVDGGVSIHLKCNKIIVIEIIESVTKTGCETSFFPPENFKTQISIISFA